MRIAIASTILLFAFAVHGDEPPKPDYSRDGMLRLMAKYDETHPPIPRKRHFHIGYVEFRAFDMDWRIFYLPLAAPLHGSGPAGARELPNPFKLTTMHLSSPGPPMLEDERSFAAQREFRRIKRLTAKQSRR